MKETMNTCIEIATCAQKTVFFAPMLSVLFIGLRLRALQITQQKGAPQGWAQQGMFLATYSVMFQLLMIFILGAVNGGKVTCVIALFKITPETATGTGSLIHPCSTF